jgi:hypothetical protein
MENQMIDVNDLNKLDCNKAREDVNQIFKGRSRIDQVSWEELIKFISQVEALQRKYTKPVAALLRKDN